MFGHVIYEHVLLEREHNNQYVYTIATWFHILNMVVTVSIIWTATTIFIAGPVIYFGRTLTSSTSNIHLKITCIYAYGESETIIELSAKNRFKFFMRENIFTKVAKL